MTEVLCQKIFKTSNEETLHGTKLKLSARLEIMEEGEDLSSSEVKQKNTSEI